jgi:hypothetical protein
MLTKNREKIKNLKLQLSVINYIDIKHMIDYSKKKTQKKFHPTQSYSLWF